MNLDAVKFSPFDNIHRIQCMSMIFGVDFQRNPLILHLKYSTHTNDLRPNLNKY